MLEREPAVAMPGCDGSDECELFDPFEGVSVGSDPARLAGPDDPAGVHPPISLTPLKPAMPGARPIVLAEGLQPNALALREPAKLPFSSDPPRASSGGATERASGRASSRSRRRSEYQR